MYKHRVLIVDDEPSIVAALELIFSEKGYEVETAASAAAALALAEAHPFDLMFTDLRLPDSDGIELLSRVKASVPGTQVILMTAHGSTEITIEAIKLGAFYYVEKPFTPDHALTLAERALQYVTVKRENRALREALADDGEAFGVIGRDARMRHIRGMIRTAAPSDASVLIEGESGTGKELIAIALHANSNRAGGPFISINCAAIPSDLIESELFGYKKGAFTGADRDKRGLIEAASGGTLLLDEIGEMPPHLQTKLLRVLQERSLRRLGDEHEVAVDFRLISSTNRDTAQMIREGGLRKDLYFRISTIKISVPPLRARPDDIALLAERFLRRYAEQYKKRIRGISQSAFSLLTRYEWPGNVRELESAIEHAVLFARGDKLSPQDLPEQFHATPGREFRCFIPPCLTMEQIEHEAIVQTLERTGWNIKKTAELLDYCRPKLYRRLRKFGLKSETPRAADVG
ncbi:MAG TPA: sigma-54 dependent transcriptional regulator [Pyrinomonadaceae bacterium]|jgi:DNA-binding NtrC family response regulator|nr:sigma-54 dependent transcriptional regulator [Pyrinomonadaceae bacterium]